MGVYGKLMAANDEAFAEQEAKEKVAAKNSVYGPLMGGGQPDAAAAAPLEESPIGADYTLAELQAAIEGDPKLASELVLTELKRPQGTRKGALQHFAKLDLDETTAKLVADALAVFDKPVE